MSFFGSHLGLYATAYIKICPSLSPSAIQPLNVEAETEPFSSNANKWKCLTHPCTEPVDRQLDACFSQNEIWVLLLKQCQSLMSQCFCDDVLSIYYSLAFCFCRHLYQGVFPSFYGRWGHDCHSFHLILLSLQCTFSKKNEYCDELLYHVPHSLDFFFFKATNTLRNNNMRYALLYFRLVLKD